MRQRRKIQRFLWGWSIGILLGVVAGILIFDSMDVPLMAKSLGILAFVLIGATAGSAIGTSRNK